MITFGSEKDATKAFISKGEYSQLVIPTSIIPVNMLSPLI